MDMRLVQYAALVAAIGLVGCSGDDSPTTSATDAPASSVAAGDACDVATEQVIGAWFGWDVESVTAEGSCRFSGLPFGELAVASGDAGISVTGPDGFTDPHLADFLSEGLAADGGAIEARRASIAELDVDGSPWRCGLLAAAGADDLMVWAQPSRAELGDEWSMNGLARIEFGDGLSEDVCTSPEPTRTVQAAWPVTFDRFEFELTPVEGGCGAAAIVLHGAVVLTPDGGSVPLPDPLTTRNSDFGVFAPADCQLR